MEISLFIMANVRTEKKGNKFVLPSLRLKKPNKHIKLHDIAISKVLEDNYLRNNIVVKGGAKKI